MLRFPEVLSELHLVLYQEAPAQTSTRKLPISGNHGSCKFDNQEMPAMICNSRMDARSSAFPPPSTSPLPSNSPVSASNWPTLDYIQNPTSQIVQEIELLDFQSLHKR